MDGPPGRSPSPAPRSARCIYDEGIDLREIGTLKITRASHVEPDRDGFWWADMGP